ncbi:hypothetical protein DYB30_009302, partial [Aphanomyces astaci]
MSTAAIPTPIPEEVGLLLNPQQRNAVQDRVNALLGWNSRELAPMSTSMPMLRSNRKQIVELGYLVGSMWTGIRYLALLVTGRCYLISHNYEIRETWLFTPLRQQDRPQSMTNGDNELSQHMWTILDGTLVLNQDKLCFVISDILAMNGASVMSLKLEDRLKTIQNSVISPLLKIPLPKGHPPSQFSLLFPPNRPLNKMTSSIRQLTPTPANTAVQHSGLVFIPMSLPYAPGHSKGVYYWTFPSTTTAFFQLGVDWRGMPKKPVFKLNVFDKGMSVFYDWITFPPGGWKLLRVRKDIGRPTERGHLAALEKALVHDPIRGDEIELYFTSDHHPSLKPSSSIAAIAPSSSSGPTLSSQPPPNLAPDEMDKWKKSGGGGGPPGQGVCYDFQNKGVCQRGPKCHFSHCACHNVCQCTPAGHTYGQRPDFRRNDLDAPPPDSSSANTPDGMTNLMEGGVVKDAAVVDDGGKMAGLASPPDDAPTLPGGGGLRVTSSSLSGVYAPLTAWNPEAVAAKRQLLTATANRRMWSSLGILDDGNASSAKKKKAGGRNYT